MLNISNYVFWLLFNELSIKLSDLAFKFIYRRSYTELIKLRIGDFGAGLDQDLFALWLV